MVLEISSELAVAIQQEAETHGKSVEDFLRIALKRERVLSERQKIAEEQAWWGNLPLTERAKYAGKYIAVHNQKLVDHDTDEVALYQRIREKYGKTAVLIMPAEGVKDIQIHSPRISQR